MSDVKIGYIDYELNGRVYPLALTLNVIDALQDRYKNLDKVLDESKKLKEVKWVLAQLINDSIDNHNDDHPDKWEHVTEAWVGRKIKSYNILQARKCIMDVFLLSIPKSEDEDADPNSNATA